MKKSKIILIIMFNIIYSLMSSQEYDGVFIEKRKIDDNKIYNIGKTFYYEIIGEANQNKEIKGVKLAVIKSNIFNRTNKNQTEISYIFYPYSNIISRTGVVENDVNIWLHPPRIDFLECLETCPFPYIKLDKKDGYKWEDKMRISEHWSGKEGGEWKGKLTLNYSYEILGTEVLKTKLGNIKCTKIYAIGVSEIGNSYLVAHFSDEFGFVKLEYTLFTGKKITLELEKIEFSKDKNFDFKKGKKIMYEQSINKDHPYIQ